MSNIKITQLPELAPTPLSGTDVFPVVSSNVTYQVTANAIADFISGSNANSISNGASNVSIPNPNGNIFFGLNGSNAFTFGTDGNLSFLQGTQIQEVASPVPGNYAVAIRGTGGVSPDQQLLVYPTSLDANHLHLTSGNLYNTELYLGNDNLYVKLANTGAVIINSDDGTGNTAQWNFDASGVLTLPGEGIVRSNNDTIVLQSWDTANSLGYGLRIGTQGGLYLEQGANSAWLNITPSAGNAEIFAATGSTGNAGKALFVRGGAADQGTFNASPGGNVYIDGGLGAFNDGGGGGPGGWVNISAGLSSDPAGVPGNVTVNVGANAWLFDNTGNLSAPGIITANTFVSNAFNVVTAGNLSIRSQYGLGTTGTILEQDGGLEVIGNGGGYAIVGWNENYGNVANLATVEFNTVNSPSNVLVTTGNLAGTTYNWVFDNAGNLTVPLNIIANGASPAPVLQNFTFDSFNGIISSLGTSFDIGAKQSPTTGAGYNLALAAGSGLGNIGGNVNITAGFGANSIGNGNITLNSGPNTWNFDNTGNLTLPANTFAVNYANGTPVSLGGGGGNSISNGTSNVIIPVADGNISFNLGNVTAGNISASSVALGVQAGQINQGTNAVAVGLGAGGNTQSFRAVAVGQNAGNNTQGASAVAVGRNAGQTTQGNFAVAVGAGAGGSTQGIQAIAMGSSAASTNQGDNAVALGAGAGQTSQGANAVALGRSAGLTNQPASSIIINATGSPLNGTNSGFYVAPVRNDTGNVTNVVYYNTTTNEVTFGPASGSSYGNTQVGTYLASGTVATDYLTSGNVSATGNVTGGNLLSTGFVSATGNVRGSNINTAGDVSAAGNVTATGTGSNLVRRAYGIAGSNVAVTLDNIEARVGGTPIRLYINTVGNAITGAGDSQTLTSGTAAVSSWINVPIGTGAANAFAMSGALTSNGDTAILSLIDQGAGSGMWRITGMIANTTANLYGVSIERLV